MGGPGRIGGVHCYNGEIKNFAFFQTRKFSKMLKKINEKFTILRKFSNLHTKISMENWFFTHFLSHLPGLVSFYTPLEHTKIFWVGLGGSSAGLGGYFRLLSIFWGLYKPLTIQCNSNATQYSCFNLFFHWKFFVGLSGCSANFSHMRYFISLI